MDFNGILNGVFLLSGRYDKGTVRKSRFRIAISYFLIFVNLFCGAKLFVVLLAPFFTKNESLLFYLVDIYLLRHEIQSAFFVAVVWIHLFIAYIYWAWDRLSDDPRRMQCLSIFFTPDINELCKNYDLKRKEVEKFVKKAERFKRIFYFVSTSFLVLWHLLVARCLMVSYVLVTIKHLVFIVLPMAIVTLVSYWTMAAGFLTTYLLNLLMMDFLALRMNTIGDQIRKELGRTWPEQITAKGSRVRYLVMAKKRKKINKILRTIHDVVVQFKESNQLFDNMVTPIFVGTLLGCLVHPGILFLDIPLLYKFLFFTHYFIAISFNCFLIAIWNEGFKNSVSLYGQLFCFNAYCSLFFMFFYQNRLLVQVQKFASSIHHSLPGYKAFDVKMNLSNFLALDGIHRRLSFTYLRTFDYSIDSLIGKVSFHELCYDSVRKANF